jgi:hypothetical protein
MQEPTVRTEILPPPPGIIGSLRTGFDTIAVHITAILMPLALDLLLWLGPHLSMDRLSQPILENCGSMAASSGFASGNAQDGLQLCREFFQQFNLFSLLRTFPIGVSSLMRGRLLMQSPLGTPVILQVDTVDHLFGLMLLLTLLGWVFGALYFRWIARIVMAEASAATGYALVQAVLYSLICLLLSWTVGLPVLLFFSLVFTISPLLGEVGILLLGFLSMWLIVPIFFSPYGMFMRQQNALTSILSSFQMARFTLPTSSLFVLTVFLIGVGLNFLWSIPASDSWLALVGILGHAFITTALLASSFVYYHDMTVWLQTVLERMRARIPTQQA